MTPIDNSSVKPPTTVPEGQRRFVTPSGHHKCFVAALEGEKFNFLVSCGDGSCGWQGRAMTREEADRLALRHHQSRQTRPF